MLRVALLALDSEPRRFLVQYWKKVTINICEREGIEMMDNQVGSQEAAN